MSDLIWLSSYTMVAQKHDTESGMPKHCNLVPVWRHGLNKSHMGAAMWSFKIPMALRKLVNSFLKVLCNPLM